MHMPYLHSIHIIPNAVRIPVQESTLEDYLKPLAPGRWIYLRGWNKIGDSIARRTSSTGDIEVTSAGIWFKIEGLPSPQLRVGDSVTANMAKVDAWLLRHGAEACPSAEWPDQCVGEGYRADRPPFNPDLADLSSL